MTITKSNNNPHYSIIEWTAEECKKVQIEFPCFSAIPTETLGEIDKSSLHEVYINTESDFYTREETEKWLL